MKKIRILVADDQIVFCEAVRYLLQRSSDIEVIGMAQNGVELIEQVSTTLPDVVLMDVNMPVMNGVESTRLVLQEHRYLKVIALTMHKNSEVLRQMVGVGAHGFLLKDTSFNELTTAIRSVVAGNYYFSSRLKDIM